MDVEAIFSKAQLLQHCEAVVVGPIDLYLLVYRYISFAQSLGFSIASNLIILLKRSPSIEISSSPPCAFARSPPILSPSPLPSVFLDSSPLTNLYISSSGEISSSVADTFLKEIHPYPSD